LILVILSLAAVGWVARPYLNLDESGTQQLLIADDQAGSNALVTPTLPATIPAVDSPTPTQTVLPVSLPGSGAPEKSLTLEGVLLLALRDGYHIHLFAYHPLYLPLTRLTDSPWDDISPALSPDGTKLAYSSRQNGYWDIYILDLVSGRQQRVTDTPEYEASPSWSPDGQWLAFERFNGANMDIFIQSLSEAGAEVIQLTDDQGSDHSPAWSPAGREIAFVSTRSGDEEIWLARLDEVDERFVNLSRSTLSRDRYPVWSSSGRRLAWSAETAGSHQFVVFDQEQPDLPARAVAEGSRLAWSPDESVLFSEIRDPMGSGLAAYSTTTGRLSLPLTALPGSLYGMVWVKGPIVGWLASRIDQGDTAGPPVLWEPVITRTVAPAGRMGLVALEDVAAPQALLHDAVDEAYVALRRQIARETGWDTLSSLENAYVALTTPPNPSIQNDWLYTGRAFSVNPLLVSAGWMAITREDFGGQIYWRVFLKARYQDGSMGLPLYDMVWDLNARYSGDPQAYEQGGLAGRPPPGYWIDLTELAGRYGWQRLPSWTNWRTFFPSIRFNQFVIPGGMDWYQAMIEIYPLEALRTATSIPTMTPRPSGTSGPGKPSDTPTAAPTVALVETRRPTWTAISP